MRMMNIVTTMKIIMRMRRRMKVATMKMMMRISRMLIILR
jgi:hypothetical protein